MKITNSMFDAEIELRSDEDKKTLTGYAAKFDSLSVPLFGFREKIRKGAFANSIKKNNIRSLWNHNTDLVLGSTKNKTLQLEEDDKGLRFELDLPDTQAGRDAAVSVSRKDVEGMSFSFEVKKEEWDETKKDNVIRTLIEVDLKEVSPTAFPAYPKSSVVARSVKDDYEDYTEEKRSMEEKEQKAEEEKQKAINNLELNKQKESILEKEML